MAEGGEAGADFGGGQDGDLAFKAADPAQERPADTDRRREVEPSVRFVDQDHIPSKPVDHGFPEIGGAPEGDTVLRPAVHVEMFFQVGRQAELVVELPAAAGLIFQDLDPAHPVHTIVPDSRRLAVVLVGNQIVAPAVPGQLPGTDGVVFAVGIVKRYLPPGVDGLVQSIDGVEHLGILAPGPPRHIDLTLELGRLMVGCQLFQLADQGVSLFLRDEPAALDCIHQQLELGQLKGAVGQPIAAAPAPLQHNVIAHLPQCIDVGIDALALAGNALGDQHLCQLRHREAMFFVGLQLKNARQGEQLVLLLFLSGHGRTLLFSLSRVSFCQTWSGAGWTAGTSLPDLPGLPLPAQPAAAPAPHQIGRSLRSDCPCSTKTARTTWSR